MKFFDMQLLNAIYEATNYYLKISIPLFVGIVISKLLFIKLKFIERKANTLFRKTFNILFLLSLISPYISNVLLSEFSKRRIYNDKETIFVALLLSLPKYIYHLILTLPIIIPLLNILAIKYFIIIIITILIQMLLTFVVVKILGLKINKEYLSINFLEENNSKNFIKDVILSFTKISILFIITSSLLLYLYNVEYIKNIVSNLNILNLDANMLAIILSYLFKPIIAYTIASNLINIGYDENSILFTLVLSSYISFYVFAFKFLLPSYSAIFGIKLGGKIILTIILFRTPIYICMTILLYNLLL